MNQLLYLCNEICNALDNNKELRIIFLDISKAFDRVWHKGLLFKLKSIGVSGHWNLLDHDIRDSSTLYSFKRKLNAQQQQQLPPPHLNFIQTSRLGQILHARLRLECSSLNHHLYRKNLVESPLCSCGVPETNSHFLLSCANYNNIRQRYFSGLGLPLTVNILLNGKPEETLTVNNNIFRCVQLYILATKRFS